MLSQMKPPPEKKESTSVDLLVDVMPLKAETVSFRVSSQGTVQPRTETVLSAEVAGAIVSISPKFIPGGVFDEDEIPCLRCHSDFEPPEFWTPASCVDCPGVMPKARPANAVRRSASRTISCTAW